MIKFGTGGWRAVIGDDFTRENISKVAQAISDILAQDGKTDKPIMIGFDRRFLSEADTEDLASSYMTAFESFVSENILGGNV